MNVSQPSSGLLRTSVRLAIWGIGLYVGLRLAKALTKPTGKEKNDSGTNLGIKNTFSGHTKTSKTSVKIPVVDVSPVTSATSADEISSE